MNLYYNQDPIATLDAALPQYPADELASPTRSTVALLSWLKHEPLGLQSLLRDVVIPVDCSQNLEYQVKPLSGRGKASHTDVMLIARPSALAIEAKWTEPRYEPVGQWVLKGIDCQNRKLVLSGWLGLLQKHASRRLRVEDFSDAVYQMVHRAASACAAGDQARLAYLVFEPSPRPGAAGADTIRADLEHLRELLGHANTLPMYLVEVPLSPTPAFAALASLPKATDETAQRVRDALVGTAPLFDFDPYRLTRIGAAP